MTLDVKRYPILVVDDEQDNLDAFRFNFRKTFDILTATSGPEALQILAEKEVAVVVTDQRMPKMTGVELLRRCPGILDGDRLDRRGNGGDRPSDPGLVISSAAASEQFAEDFVTALQQHRFWERTGRNRLAANGDRETRGYADPPEPRAGQAGLPAR